MSTQTKPTPNRQKRKARYNGKITPEFFEKIKDQFKIYRASKRSFDMRIIENNRWFKNQYTASNGEIPEITTSYLFNVLANKHAEIMDSYPEANIMERDKKDRKLALTLSKIIPQRLDLCNFKQTYSRAWWYKLKNGASCYGVFFDPTIGAYGDISIKKIDLLNLFWEPGVTDIQDSSFLFLTSLCSSGSLKQKYPEYDFSEDAGAATDILTYDDNRNTPQSEILRDKILVVDCYYKKHTENGSTVELIKFCGDNILAASEDMGDGGIYDHGMYPFVIDPLYPDEDSPVSFGMIDIIKNPQRYIDKLDEIICRNALISGKKRFMIKDNGGVNENELCDLSKDIIHVAGSVLDENIRELETSPLHNYIIEHRQNKINELKEISGNRDFMQGGTTGGVTAYSAIAALQNAGEKISRDMLSEGYEAYRRIIAMLIELMRQFQPEPRQYRVGNGISREYIEFSSKNLDDELIRIGDESLRRRIEFDIIISPQKNNPYSRITQNQTLLDLWKSGVFDPQNREEAILLIECMQFDGKDRILDGLKKSAEKGEMKNG